LESFNKPSHLIKITPQNFSGSENTPATLSDVNPREATSAANRLIPDAKFFPSFCRLFRAPGAQ
jgi:hypothetical protein